jgi:hypothetical protein
MLDQLLAPSPSTHDSLLPRSSFAATYPLEVVMAERWARENRHLPASSGMRPWPAALGSSVKDLAPFPDVLEMMSRKLDWTQRSATPSSPSRPT